MTTNYNYRPFPPGCVSTVGGQTGILDSSLQNLNGGSLRNSKTTELFTQSVNGGNFDSPALSLEADNFRPAQLQSLGNIFLSNDGGFMALDNSEVLFAVGDLVITNSELYPGYYRVTEIAGDVAVTDGVYVELENVSVWKVLGGIAGNDNGEFLITSRSTVEQISNKRKSHYLKSLRT